MGQKRVAGSFLTIGTMTLLSFAGAIYRGYTSDYDIILVWGGPTAEQLKTFELMNGLERLTDFPPSSK